MSGCTPLREMSTPAGVRYRATVSFSAAPEDSWTISWTSDFP
jgi:hypothetical protein